MVLTTTISFETSLAPSCVLVPQQSLFTWISDNTLAVILPSIVYVVAGAFFHLLDAYQVFNSYRIHPSEDELKRNHVTKWQCFKAAVRYHIMQISIGLLLIYNDGPAMTGDEVCKIEHTATVLRSSYKIIPILLNILGINASQLSQATRSTSITLAQIIDPSIMVEPTANPLSSPLTSTELLLAKLYTRLITPFFQYFLALIVVDTWIYFTHRLCHANLTLYRLVHAQHHRLYVSYAYGAVYAHWLETLFLDILSFILAGQIAHLNARQTMLFGSMATIKTISDHCG
ncbi:MAG: hypothetical protein L6R41_008329, partial [Letrouitia leprolyta]